MMETKLATIEQLPVNTVTPMMMLQTAVAKGTDLAQLQQLMDLQERWEKNEARKAFVTALNAFKANPPDIFKNKAVKYGNTAYKHATLDNVSMSIGEALAGHGISHRWDVEQLPDGVIKVTCILTHAMGHSEKVPMQALADNSGSKNNIQAIGSTVTYLQRYTLLAATGMAAQEQDDDGRGKREEVTPDAEGKKALEACGSMAALSKAWNALTVEQRKTLNEVKESCKQRISDADKATA
jgi:hypothetical protein